MKERFDSLWKVAPRLMSIVVIVGVIYFCAAQTVDLQHRFEDMDKRLVNMDKRLVNVEERLANVEIRLTKVEVRLDRLEEKVDRIETKLDRVIEFLMTERSRSGK